MMWAGVNITSCGAAYAATVLTGGLTELERIALPEDTDQIWHGYIPEVHPGSVYGFRVHGPYLPAEVTVSVTQKPTQP